MRDRLGPNPDLLQQSARCHVICVATPQAELAQENTRPLAIAFEELHKRQPEAGPTAGAKPGFSSRTADMPSVAARCLRVREPFLCRGPERQKPGISLRYTSTSWKQAVRGGQPAASS